MTPPSPRWFTPSFKFQVAEVLRLDNLPLADITFLVYLVSRHFPQLFVRDRVALDIVRFAVRHTLAKYTPDHTSDLMKLFPPALWQAPPFGGAHLRLVARYFQTGRVTIWDIEEAWEWSWQGFLVTDLKPACASQCRNRLFGTHPDDFLAFAIGQMLLLGEGLYYIPQLEYSAWVRGLAYKLATMYRREELGVLERAVPVEPTAGGPKTRTEYVRHASLAADYGGKGNPTTDEVEADERVARLRDRLRAALDQLEPRLREVVCLKQDGRSHADIAKVFDITPAYSAVLYGRGKQRLRELLGGSDD